MEIKNDAFIIRRDVDKVGLISSYLMISDVHIDSKKCDRGLLVQHLTEAKEAGAKVLIFGDLFDCMGGKYDKRSNKADLRPEYQVANYFDAIVEDAAKILAPFADNILMIADGNHELSVMQRHEIDLNARLIQALNPKIHKGKYSGYIKFAFSVNGEGKRRSYNMYYNHGSGGNSPVTRGTISANRRQESREADIYVSGHNHNGWEMTRPIITLNQECNIVVKEPTHVNLGTYKNDILDGGYADMKEFAPPVLGGYWLDFEFKRSDYRFSVRRAK